MTKEWVRIIPDDSIDIGHLMDVGGTQRWYFQDGEASDAFDIHYWLSRNRRNEIHLVDDFVIGTQYIVVEGPEAEAIIEQIRQAIPIYTLEQLRLRLDAADTLDQRARAVAQLALATTKAPNPTDLPLLEAALADPNTAVRRTAAIAVGYVEWPELRARLTEMHKTDPDEEVRDAAGRMHDAMSHTDAIRKARGD